MEEVDLMKASIEESSGIQLHELPNPFEDGSVFVDGVALLEMIEKALLNGVFIKMNCIDGEKREYIEGNYEIVCAAGNDSVIRIQIDEDCPAIVSE